MSDINSLLNDLKKKLLKSRSEKDIIVSVISKNLNISLNEKDVYIRKETIYLKVNPYIKSELSLKKELILKDIKKQGIDKTIKDIK
jgi:hypothetical protein